MSNKLKKRAAVHRRVLSVDKLNRSIDRLNWRLLLFCYKTDRSPAWASDYNFALHKKRFDNNNHWSVLAEHLQHMFMERVRPHTFICANNKKLLSCCSRPFGTLFRGGGSSSTLVSSLSFGLSTTCRTTPALCNVEMQTINLFFLLELFLVDGQCCNVRKEEVSVKQICVFRVIENSDRR